MNVKTSVPASLPVRRVPRGPASVCATRAADACQGCRARSAGFCGTLPARLQSRLSGLAAQSSLKADHWLWDIESGGEQVTVVRKGYLRLLRYSLDGRRLLTGIAGPGAVVGEVLSRRGRYGVECATDVSLCTFGRTAFRQLEQEDTDFRRALYAERSRSLEALHRHIWTRGLQTPEERLAAFLVQSCAMLPYQPLPGGGGVLTLEIPRVDIADLIGTTRETISRLTHRWQDEGLVTIPDAAHLILHDPALLARRGGLNPALLAPGPGALPPDVIPAPVDRQGPAPAPRPAQQHYL